MDGRAYLDVARDLVRGPTEAHWRAGAGRAYYALLLEGRDALGRWGFTPPSRDQVHYFVAERFRTPSDPDLQRIGDWMDRLRILRNQADYVLSSSIHFRSRVKAQQAVHDAGAALTLLDQIDGSLQRRTFAVAAIRAAFP